MRILGQALIELLQIAGRIIEVTADFFIYLINASLQLWSAGVRELRKSRKLKSAPILQKPARRDQGVEKAARRILGSLESLLPERLKQEDVGDALERITRWVREGCPRWQVYGLIASSVGWLILNGAREWMSVLASKALNRYWSSWK